MCKSHVRCVLLADAHHALSEGIRGLLGTTFGAVLMVSDEVSLFEGASRLRNELAIVDASLTREGVAELISRLHRRFPDMKLLVLGVHDHPALVSSVMAAGANGFVLKRTISIDLLPAIDAIFAGHDYVLKPPR